MKILKEKGKTNYQIWKEIKINQGQLSSFLKGKRGMSLKKLQQIANHLGYEISIVKKSKIRGTRHEKKVVVGAKIAEREIEGIIEVFQTNYDVQVRSIDITIGYGKVKIYYDTGRYIPGSTKERKKPEESEKPSKYRRWGRDRDPLN